MSFELTSISGSGEVKPDSIFNYTYSEEVTSLSPSESAGGTSQVNISAVANDKSPLLINNTVKLTDSMRGSVVGKVSTVSINNDLVSITADTIMSRLNVERTAGPVGGTELAPASLKDAIDYYCSLVSVPVFYDGTLGDALADIPVNFIGWNGNVWEYLKMLCSAQSASLVDDVAFEMYILEDELHFRYAVIDSVDLSEVHSEYSLSFDSSNSAEKVGIYHYKTSYGQNKVFYELTNYDPNVAEEDKFQSSINDIMQVDAGETITRRFMVDASLTSVNQPECVATITRIPPAPYADGGVGQYVIVGSDDLPIQPSQWTSLGGKLTVSLTENPGEIELTITAPNAPELKQAEDPSKLGYAPYKIGAESSGEKDYPALWLTGTGVFYEKNLKTMLTGAPSTFTSDLEAPTIDNPFIADLHSLSNRGVVAAQTYCGPVIRATRSTPLGGFGEPIGKTEKIGDLRFRYESAAYSPSGVQLTGRAYASFNEFDEQWVDVTFADFDTAKTGLKFNEFSTQPLKGAN